MRFFDDEEVMLFSFPQSDYQDGTFIDKAGNASRLNEYTIKPLDFTEAGGHKFSFGWELEMKGVKGEQYKIIPKMDGQMNLTYYELLADIIDKAGNNVGLCVVELLPGVYNEHIKVWAVLARVK